MSTTALLIFNGAMLFLILTAILASQKGKPWTDVMADTGRLIAAGLGRVKVLLAAIVTSIVALYDVVTAGGIDLNAVLRPIVGDRIDVGRTLATTALVVVLLRFTMQSGMFKATNKNGIDNPDEPDHK